MKNQKSIVLLRPLKSIVDNEKLKIQLFNYNVYFGKSGDGQYKVYSHNIQK